MAARKKPIFGVAEWERQRRNAQKAAAQTRKGRTKSESQLSKAVKNYNARINRALKTGKIRPENAPPRASVAEIKRGISPDLTPLQRGKALSEAARQLDRARAAAMKTVKTQGGVEVTQYDYNQAIRNFERAKRKQAEEEAKKKAAEAAAPKFGGVNIERPRAWGEGATPGNPETAKTWERFRERAEAAIRYLRGNEWELYRANLLKNYEMHYTGKTLKQLKRQLKRISNSNLERAYRAGAKFALQDYQYESEPEIQTMLETMQSWVDTK